MKKHAFFLFLFAAFSASSTSCSSNNNPTGNSGIDIDSNVFFTINFNGRTLTTNGLISDQNSSFFNQYCSALVASQGSSTSSIVFNVRGSALNGLYQNSSQLNFLGSIFINNTTTLGTYNLTGNASYIFDLTSSTNSLYYLATPQTNPEGGSYVTITDIDQVYIAGILNFELINGSNKIPASGSFRLYKQ